MAMSNSNMDYNNCVANCKALFPNSEAALVACINGCAKVNSPAGAAIGADLGLSFETEVQKVGRDEYLKKIRSAARSACKLMADFDSMDRMEPLAKRYLTQVHELVEFGAKLSEWDDAAMARYAGEVAWAKFATDVVAAMARDNSGGGGGSGPTCVTRCADEYDQCVRELRYLRLGVRLLHAVQPAVHGLRRGMHHPHGRLRRHRDRLIALRGAAHGVLGQPGARYPPGFFAWRARASRGAAC